MAFPRKRFGTQVNMERDPQSDFANGHWWANDRPLTRRVRYGSTELSYHLDSEQEAPGPFPTITDLSMWAGFSDANSVLVVLWSRSRGVLASVPFWDRLKKLVGTAEKIDDQTFPAGTLDEHYWDCDDGYLYEAWRDDGFVYVLWGTSCTADEFASWFRVPEHAFDDAWHECQLTIAAARDRQPR
jgi:hypothetical protein